MTNKEIQSKLQWIELKLSQQYEVISVLSSVRDINNAQIVELKREIQTIKDSIIAASIPKKTFFTYIRDWWHQTEWI